MIKEFRVRIQTPDEVSMSEMRDFIRSAILAFGGGLRPENPLFDQSDRFLSINPIKEKAK